MLPHVRAAPLLTLALLSSACGGGAPSSSTTTGPASSTASPASVSLPAADETALLDAAFRIDIREVQAVLDVFPDERRVEGRARLTFVMRPGQRRPLVHLDPGASGDWRGSLDGQPLDGRSAADVRVVVFDGSTQRAREIQRDLAAGSEHVLEMTYRPAFVDAFARFYTDVNDLAGRGNEALWPTLNTPHELARHLVTLRVHSTRPYVGVGSGLFQRTGATDAQEWRLDSEREVASYTILFYLAPAADVTLGERRVAGVDVRVLSPVGGPAPEEALAQLEGWLLELDAAMGPFPMPRGLSLVLTPTGGGMEYFGGSITSLRALQHEVFHMYWGCSTVLRTYRDSWLDEAVNMWYELSKDPAFTPIEESFRSDIVSARSPIGTGFDRRAYEEGARVVQAIARDLGSRAAAVAWLRQVHATRSFAPFTTMDFAGFLRQDRGLDFSDRLQRWLYSASGTTTLGARPGEWDWIDQVDLTPPDAVRRRYR